jgi:hypothetical protein
MIRQPEVPTPANATVLALVPSPQLRQHISLPAGEEPIDVGADLLVRSYAEMI